MKLFKVPNNSLILVDIPEFNGRTIEFHHIDGAYSLCRVQETGEIIHLSASTEVNSTLTGSILFPRIDPKPGRYRTTRIIR